MIKVKIEGDETPKMELEGKFTWGAVESDDGRRAFAVGREDPMKLVIRMAEICTGILLNVWNVDREDPAAVLIKRLFVKAIENEFEEASHEEVIKECRVERCEE